MRLRGKALRIGVLVFLCSILALCLTASPAGASARSTTISDCTLYAPYPDYANGYMFANGGIDCNSAHTLRLEVCARVWGNNQWNTKSDTCVTYGPFYGSLQAGSPGSGWLQSNGWGPVKGHTYCSWVWTEVDSTQKTYQGGALTY